MSKLKRLAQSYTSYIKTPWREDAAAPQRVIFCVYNQKEELRLRASLGEFEIETKNANHDWALFDLTNQFPRWLASQRYRVKYFEKPDLISTLLPRFTEFITKEFISFLEDSNPDSNTVVALTGAGSLFGIVKVKEVVDNLAPLVKGRLLVFFPGRREGNNYRLLDGYDGWNYLAVSITAD